MHGDTKYPSGIDATDHHLFRALFDASPDGLLLVGPDGLIRLANNAAGAMFGVDSDELVGADVDRLVPDDDRVAHGANVATFFARPGRRPMGSGLELSAQHVDGSLFPVEISLSPVELEGAPLVIAAVRDVTERRRTRSNLALMEDRARIARDLHDMVIQRVFAAGMSIQALHPLVESPVALERLSEITDELDETIRELRAAIFRLGNVDDDQSLVAQVQGVIAERSRVLGFAPDLTVNGSFDDVPKFVVEHLIATLTEALSNVARHAAASSTTVRLDRMDDHVRVKVTDDGVGITAEPGARGGLSNMMWRAAELGGECLVERAAPSGTRVAWRVPI